MPLGMLHALHTFQFSYYLEGFETCKVWNKAHVVQPLVAVWRKEVRKGYDKNKTNKLRGF
jgi:hypothetical protein